MIGLEFVLRLFAQGHDFAHVALVESGENGGGLLGHDELSCDLAAKRRHFLPGETLSAGRHRFSAGLFRPPRLFLVVGRRCGFRLQMREDVAFHDPTALAAAADFGGIDFLFRDHSFDRGRKNLGVGGTQLGRFGSWLGVVRGSRLGPGRRRRLVIDYGDDFPDFYLLAFVYPGLEHAGFFGGDFSGNFVGLESEESFAGVHVIARFPVPDGDDPAFD